MTVFNHHATNATADTRPTFLTTGLGQYTNLVRFDAIDGDPNPKKSDMLFFNPFAQSTNQTVFILYNDDASTVDQGHVLLNRNLDQAPGLYAARNNGSSTGIRPYYDSDVHATCPSDPSGWQLGVWGWTNATQLSAAAFTAVGSIGSGFSLTTTWASDGPDVVSSWIAFNDSSANQQGTRLDVAAILVYDRILDPTEMDQMVGYFYSQTLVPEPSTVLLLGVGGLLLWRWRRDRRERTPVESLVSFLENHRSRMDNRPPDTLSAPHENFSPVRIGRWPGADDRRRTAHPRA